MSWRRQLCCVVAIAILGGVGVALTSGSVHEAIRYGIAVATGAFLGLGLAKR
jgi:hypothetical protein